ncbi:hypothetical protein ACFQ61_28715 [Streptomyces sp. NPDC056500]|uniref:hypothetical protein n=1 Tax=Streptomyces sp. NPDC056500 TaxID=3345840 RepID=UPI0036ABF1CC
MWLKGWALLWCLGALLLLAASPSMGDALAVGERDATALPGPTAATPGGNTDTGKGAGVDDVHTVYCLAKERRKAVVDAAVRLGVATEVKGKPERLLSSPPGPSSKASDSRTVEEWAEERRDSFRRVCAAVMEADANASSEPGASGPSLLETLVAGALLAVLGAGLTLLGGASERSSARRRAQADELDGATIRFALAVEGYLSVWEGERDASYSELDSTRGELVVALRRFGVAGSRRVEALALAGSLPFGEPLSDQTVGGPQGNRLLKEHEKQAEANRQRTLLQSTLSDVERLVSTSLLRHVRRVLPGRAPRGGRV